MTIYVLRHSDDDIWKIGYTNGDASARPSQLQTGNPDKLELYAEFPGDVPLEKAIHEHLTLCHTTGGSEWFVASQDEIDEVIQTYRFKWASEPIGKTNVACRDCYYLRSSTDNRGREVHTCGILWDRTWSALHGAMVMTNQQSIEKARSRIGECGPSGKLYKNAEEERQRQQRLQQAEAARLAKLRAEQIRMHLKDGLVICAVVVPLIAFVMLSSALYRVIVPPRMDTPTSAVETETIVEGAVQPTVTPPRTQTDVARELTETPLLIPTETPTPIMTQTPESTVTPAPTAIEAPRPTVTATQFAVNVITAANLRAGPGTEHAIGGAARPGELLTIVSVNPTGDWLQVVDGSWIAATLVSRAPVTVSSESIASVPTVMTTPAPTETITVTATSVPKATLQPAAKATSVPVAVATSKPVSAKECLEQSKGFFAATAPIVKNFSDAVASATNNMTLADRSILLAPVAYMIGVQSNYDAQPAAPCTVMFKALMSTSMSNYIRAFSLFIEKGPVPEVKELMDRANLGAQVATGVLNGWVEEASKQ